MKRITTRRIARLIAKRLPDEYQAWVAYLDNDLMFECRESIEAILISLANAIVLERDCDEIRHELTERLRWSLVVGGDSSNSLYDWEAFAERVGRVICVYKCGSEVAENDERKSFLMGTSENVVESLSKFQLIRVGRFTNDFRRAVYLFKNNKAGRRLAQEAATISSEHSMMGGAPLVMRVSIKKDAFDRLIKFDMTKISPAICKIMMLGIARNRDRTKCEFPLVLEDIYKQNDIIVAPLTKWSGQGWDVQSGVQVALRTEFAVSQFSIDDVESTHHTYERCNTVFRKYEEYWCRLVQTICNGERALRGSAQQWKKYSGLRLFSHNHPMYYAAPLLVDMNRVRSYPLKLRFECIDHLTVGAGVGLIPDIRSILQQLKKHRD